MEIIGNRSFMRCIALILKTICAVRARRTGSRNYNISLVESSWKKKSVVRNEEDHIYKYQNVMQRHALG